jgi:hypothetical protein
VKSYGPGWTTTLAGRECQICSIAEFHSLRRANITWRQEVGGSAIEASKIAGHGDLETTSSYTFVAPERQNELTRRIQRKLAEATKPTSAPMPQPLSKLANTEPLTGVVQ